MKLRGQLTFRCSQIFDKTYQSGTSKPSQGWNRMPPTICKPHACQTDLSGWAFSVGGSELYEHFCMSPYSPIWCVWKNFGWLGWFCILERMGTYGKPDACWWLEKRLFLRGDVWYPWQQQESSCLMIGLRPHSSHPCHPPMYTPK